MPLWQIFRCPWCDESLVHTPHMLTIPFPATLEQTHFIPSRLLFSLTLDSLCSAFAVGKNWVDA